MAESRFNYVWTFLREIGDVDLAGVTGDMKCTICARLLVNANFAACGCRYCLDCVQAYLNGERRLCPGNMDDCRLEPLDIDGNILPDHPMNCRISRLIVQCRLLCGFRCELMSMEGHERACGGRSVTCPYVTVGCTQTQLASNGINAHLVGESGAHATLLMARIDGMQEEMAAMKRDAGELRAEVVEMRLAREIDQARARLTSEKIHQIEQEVANLRNENKLVKEENRALRAEMEQHRTEYLGLQAGTEQQLAELRARVETQEQVNGGMGEKCSRSEEKLGELERQARQEKEELRRNIDAARKEQASGHSEMEKRVREMGATVETHQRGGLVWRIDGWAAKSQSARAGSCKEILSDVFYSHENGYKMRLSAWPDGYDVRQGKFLSVGFHLMRGPFDNIVPWPCRCDVTLSLVDQRTGGDHASHTVTFNSFPNHAYWSRPRTDRNGSFGAWELVTLSTLRNTAGLCEDDTLFIRCVVKYAATTNTISRG